MKFIKYKHVITAFQSAGFSIVRESKHTIMRRSLDHKTVAIPRHSEVNLVIIRRLAKEVGLDLTNLLELLS